MNRAKPTPPVTTNSLAHYVGGQIEIQCIARRFLVQGEVKAVRVENNVLRVEFAFCCLGNLDTMRYSPDPRQYMEISLNGCEFMDGNLGRTVVRRKADNELWAFYPVGYETAVLPDGQMKR